MNRPTRRTLRLLVLACLTGFTPGCVAPATPVTTVWQKLGIPQTGARLRDSTLNRRGNFPGLEKKPPLLKLADPRNMAPEKPAMIQTAAKIKAEQDMKKQKIKAIKFLADVNCGCYNKDKSVEKAFLAALDDCDPDVRMAAIEAIDQTAGQCSQCRSSCETTCCTEDLYKKLYDIAYGIEDGCYKEPVQEIRSAAAAVIKKCGCPKANPIEELPLPEAEVPEELPLPDVDIPPAEGEVEVPSPLRPRNEGDPSTKLDRNPSSRVFHIADGQKEFEYGAYESPEVVVADLTRLTGQTSPAVQKASSETRTGDRITNPEQLIAAKVVEYRGSLGELLLDLPDAFQLSNGWTMVVVDADGKQSFARITDCGGRRLLLALDDLSALTIPRNKQLHLGLVDKQ